MSAQMDGDVEAQRSAEMEKAPGSLRQSLGSIERDSKRLNGQRRKELSSSLFWYQEFGTDVGCTCTYQPSRKDTFGESLSALRTALNSSTRKTRSIQICVVNTSPLTRQIYSWPTQLFGLIRGKLDYLVGVPRCAIAIEVEDAWSSLSVCAIRSIETPDVIAGVEQLSIPEHRNQFLSHTSTNCTCRGCTPEKITGEYDERPRTPEHGLLKHKSKRRRMENPQRTLFIELPSIAVNSVSLAELAQKEQCSNIFARKAASFSFTWQRSPPTYEGGFDTFLWERYSKPPPCDYAEVFYQEDGQNAAPRRVLMTVSTTPKWAKTTSLLEDLMQKSDYVWERTRGEPDAGEISDGSPSKIDLLPMLAVFEQVVADTSVFLQRGADQIMKIKFAGRGAASVQKIQYLCHLDDCRQSAWNGVDQARSVVKDILSIIPRLSLVSSLSEEVAFLQEKEKDLAYLEAKLVEMEKLIDARCSEIKSHRDLEQTRQTGLMTYIATIWVPFSFVTSMLGMNVTSPANLLHLSGGKGTTSGSTDDNTASLVSRAVLDTDTEAIITALTSVNQTATDILNQNNPYVWRFGFFVSLSGVLFVISVLLPLVGPNLLRIGVQQLYRARNWWVFWPVVFVTYYTSIYWVIPGILTGALKCDDPLLDCQRATYAYFYLYDFSDAGASNVNTISYIVSAVVMGTIGLFNLTLSVMYRRGAINTLVWLGFAAAVILSYTADYYLSIEESYPYPIGTAFSISALVPLTYLIVVWSYPLIPLLRTWYMKRQALKQKKDI